MRTIELSELSAHLLASYRLPASSPFESLTHAVLEQLARADEVRRRADVEAIGRAIDAMTSAPAYRPSVIADESTRRLDFDQAGSVPLCIRSGSCSENAPT